MKKLIAGLALVVAGSVWAEQCTIDGHTESKFIKPTPELIKFLNDETKGLFFKSDATFNDFVDKFNLLERMPGDTLGHYDSDVDGWQHRYKNGEWFGAYWYVKNGYAQLGDFDGYNWDGAIYLNNGVGEIKTWKNVLSFPNVIRIFQNLDEQYYSTDVFNAVRKKFNMKKLSTCVYQGMGDMGGSGICGSEPQLFKHNGRYFRLYIVVHGMKDYHEGTGKLDHTVIMYRTEELGRKLQEYKECQSLKTKGSGLKL